MIKKAAAVIIAAIMCVSVCGCKGGGKNAEPTPPPIVEVVPTTLVTIHDATAATGDNLVQEGGIEKDGDASYALYRGEPIGSADTVKIQIEQYSASVSKESIKQKFDKDKSLRPSAEDVEGMTDCFIAFPSAYYYKDGYYVKITAGSGSDDKQKSLLKSLISTAAKNLDSFI